MSNYIEELRAVAAAAYRAAEAAEAVYRAADKAQAAAVYAWCEAKAALKAAEKEMTSD